MTRILNIFGGIVLGLSPMTLVGVLSYIFYTEYPNIYVLLAGGVLLFIALIIGISIFRSILKDGLLKFITWQFASPELDNLNRGKKEHSE
ncbi:MAG: hypothetical protein JKY52_10495 [Flavobacteriales bacterium]|nr:hypothetical protein [Flavobacteriales bacterium]